MTDKTFNIEVTMNERWIDSFCSFLRWMENCGDLGHSSITGFYSDGDGDFRPKFKINTEFNKVDGCKENLPELEVLFDAG